MLSVGQNARRFSPSQNIHVKSRLPTDFGNVDYRQLILYWRTIGKPAGLMAGSSGKIVFLLSRMSPVIRRCAGAVAKGEVDPLDLVVSNDGRTAP